MKIYLLGYKTEKSQRLSVFKNIEDGNDYEEWCIVKANSLKQAKKRYNKSFLKEQANNFIL